MVVEAWKSQSGKTAPYKLGACNGKRVLKHFKIGFWQGHTKPLLQEKVSIE